MGGRYLDPPSEDSSFSCHSQPEMSVGPEQILVLSNIISGLVLHPEMFFKRLEDFLFLFSLVILSSDCCHSLSRILFHLWVYLWTFPLLGQNASHHGW